MTTIHITLQSGKSIELAPEEAQELRGQLEALKAQEITPTLLSIMRKEFHGDMLPRFDLALDKAKKRFTNG